MLDHEPPTVNTMPTHYIKLLKTVFLLSILCFAVQVSSALLSGSLAILTDAGHKCVDLIALALSYFAARLSQLKPSVNYTFGYYRAEILASLLNSLLLLIMAVWFAAQAAERFFSPADIELDGAAMLIGALLIFAITGVSAFLLRPVKQINLNAKAAYYHVVTDLFHSGSEILVALFVVNFQFYWLDTLLSIMLVGFMATNGTKLCWQSIRILMNFSPPSIPVARVRDGIMNQPGVAGVQELRIWSVATGRHGLTAHVVVTGQDAYCALTTERIENYLSANYDLQYVTVQLSCDH
ncbi:MAG: cation diffusion facilitator family transporter [Cyanobacteria bacterium P01_H01_bin.74]